MNYSSLKNCAEDMEKNGHLIRIKEEVDPHLEMAALHRRIFMQKGPALFFENVKGSPFPAISNLFGTVERARFIFRHNLKSVKNLVQLRADPQILFRAPGKFLSASAASLHALPRRVRHAPVSRFQTEIDRLPQIVGWPNDGGAFITLGQVYSEDPEKPGILHSNLGMYRIQLNGNSYETNKEIGLHYQIHRGIGVHHAKALERGEELRVSIFVGGPPAHTFSAVMPLPEGLPETAFAGALGGRRFRYSILNGNVLSADADFCIVGRIDKKLLPEGPFGDHLGYYSLKHDFPVLKVEAVYHRKDAIWPFTSVGRPPQEDSIFGALIHELTGPMVPASIPGLKAMHAVDAAGVHPLLLAIGSERYRPYGKRKPEELLTISNAVLGFGQASLAKYLFIVAGEDNPELNIHDIPEFFRHTLERANWQRDLHFQTCTTMDTLDYTGTGLNEGSRVVVAAAGEKIRTLDGSLPAKLSLPDDFHSVRLALPGVLVITAPKYKDKASAKKELIEFSGRLEKENLSGYPLIILADDSEFTARTVDNFLWVTFTRSNPSHDIHGVNEFMNDKHWGCEGPLIIDARIKPHHAPPLEDDPQVLKSIERLGAPGGSLHKIL